MVSVDAVPYMDGRQWPEADEVGSFTVTSTGVVYVDAASRIVWESAGGARKVLGQRPWHLPKSSEMFGRYRDLIGNPQHDLVAWVETDGGQAGDLVVVQASTAGEVARTALPEPGRAVTLASLDRERLYFGHTQRGSARDFGTGSVYEWHWSAGTPPQLAEDRGGVIDVTAGIWAVDAGPVMRFEDDRGRTLVELPISYNERAPFGYGLSPDGRFWFAASYGEFVVTATGERRPLRGPTNGHSGRFGWIDTHTFAFANRDGLHKCDATTGLCTAAALEQERPFVGPGSAAPGLPPPPAIDPEMTCFEALDADSTRCGYDLPLF